MGVLFTYIRTNIYAHLYLLALEQPYIRTRARNLNSNAEFFEVPSACTGCSKIHLARRVLRPET